jgi:hypothetical protein
MLKQAREVRGKREKRDVERADFYLGWPVSHFLLVSQVARVDIFFALC